MQQQCIQHVQITLFYQHQKPVYLPYKQHIDTRLELRACLLLSELIEIVLSSISNSIDVKNIYCWSDSLDPLFWIKGENKTQKPFIENLAIKIRKIVHPSKWRFCPGNKNPTDLSSRGIRASEFCSEIFCNWIKGLTFITKDESCQPVDASDSIYLKISKSLM